MEFSEFKKKMTKAKTMGQGDKIIAQLSDEQLAKIVQTLENAKEFSGITMRDEYILSMAKLYKEHPEYKRKGRKKLRAMS